MDRTRSLLATGLLAAALTCAACGGGDDNSSSGGGAATATPSASASATQPSSGGTLALAAPADGSLKFDKTTLRAKAGKVTIDFDNPSGTPHGVEVEGNGVEQVSKVVTKGKASVTADLKPGKYEFYCPVGNHRQAGMEGTLTVS